MPKHIKRHRGMYAMLAWYKDNKYQCTQSWKGEIHKCSETAISKISCISTSTGLSIDLSLQLFE